MLLSEVCATIIAFSPKCPSSNVPALMPVEAKTLLFIAMEKSVFIAKLEAFAISWLLLTLAPIFTLWPPIVPPPSSPSTILSILTVPPAEMPEALIVLFDKVAWSLPRVPELLGLRRSTDASKMLSLLFAKMAPDHSPTPPVTPSVVSIPEALNVFPVTSLLAKPEMCVLVSALTMPAKPLPIVSAPAFRPALFPDWLTLVFLAS